ncbi:hypothetical protein GBL97_21115, partial [Yersinia pseudotuberculosis]|nr:hypothetical protein [Yersinia pseudotuberculosis]MBO1604959.1 hypothetical protein [Yersinia pseudotuberculosis]
MKVGREAWMPSEGRLSRKRIGPVRQRNDESRDPTKWASDSAKARGSKGATLCTEPQNLDICFTAFLPESGILPDSFR